MRKTDFVSTTLKGIYIIEIAKQIITLVEHEDFRCPSFSLHIGIDRFVADPLTWSHVLCNIKRSEPCCLSEAGELLQIQLSYSTHIKSFLKKFSVPSSTFDPIYRAEPKVGDPGAQLVPISPRI